MSSPGDPPAGPLPAFVVQAHWARSFHFDLRLAMAERLVSWAIPKGPTLDPHVRRLAIRTADHPLDYALFEGLVPPDQYGAGLVMVWDFGEYRPLFPARTGWEAWLDRGHLRFLVRGHKLHGLFELVQYPKSDASAHEPWLLRKLTDRFAVSGFLPESPLRSALTGRDPERIRAEGRGMAIPTRPPTTTEATA